MAGKFSASVKTPILKIKSGGFAGRLSMQGFFKHFGPKVFLSEQTDGDFLKISPSVLLI